MAKYDKALAYYYSSLKANEEINNQSGIATAYENLCLAYAALNDSEHAAKWGELAINGINARMKTEGKSDAANDLWEVKSLEKTLGRITEKEYCVAAKKYTEDASDVTGLSNVYTFLGNYESSNKADSMRAFQYYLKAIEIQESHGCKNGIEYPLVNIGNKYKHYGNLTMALLYYDKTLALASEIDDQYYMACCKMNIAEVYLQIAGATTHLTLPDSLARASKTQLFIMAKKNYEKAIASLNSISSYDYVDGYSIVSKIDSQLGNFREAFEDYKYFARLKDSSILLRNSNEISHLEAQRQSLTDSLKAGEIERASTIKLQRQRNYTILGFTGLLLLAGFSFFIVKERRKSERLLLNILPASVAAELKAKGASDAKLFNDVTVLFSDFVGFTKVSEQLSPKELVDELNICFKAFDNIMGKHKLEKIKTIGDAYLAVCGLPAADPDHAEHTIRAAIEINSFMEDRFAKLGNRTFEIRIGVHSGNVVAGIVGVKKFAYDIWGDAVNTAARMEQNSVAGRINVSESTYELVKDKFTFEYRGEIDAKNKGMLKMYYVW